jgi:hypothetical protein
VRYDPFEKTTKIPFKVLDGKLVHLYDQEPITELQEGITGDLIVKNFAVRDAARVRQYNVERVADFLPQGTRLMARISLQGVPQTLSKAYVKNEKFKNDGAVEIILQEKLQLRLRGTKEAQLLPCKCSVPALASVIIDDLPASVNQVYTLISTHFEPQRRSHNGNVFNCVFYREEPLNNLKALRHLRDQLQADHETLVAEKPPSETGEDLRAAAPKRAGLAEAIALAAEAHIRQADKAGAPYILHPLRMMQRLETATEMIVAVLHDTVEDTHWTLKGLLAAGFSREVVDAVDCLTRRVEETYDEFIERAKSNPIARRVKLADVEDNLNITRLSEVTDRDVERLRKYHRIRRMLINGGGA